MRLSFHLREKLAPFYSEIGRPSIDPELMLRRAVNKKPILMAFT
jgi:hypothetical protein